MKREKLRWNLAVAVTLVIVLLLLSLLLATLIPQLVDNISSLLNNLDKNIDKLQTRVERMDLLFGDAINEYLAALNRDGGLLSKATSLLSENLKAILATTGTIGSAAMSWIVGAFIATYFLFSKRSIFNAITHFLKLVMRSQNYIRTEMVLNKFNTIFSRYIVCEILDALLVGIATGVFCLILGTPDALFLSVIAGVTNLAPTFGPIVGAAICGFLLLLEAPSFVLPFLIFTLVIQLLDSYVIKPKLFGGVLNVPGVVILIAIIVFGELLGVVGMLIAIPISALLVYFYSEMLIPWLELRRELREYQTEMAQQKPQDGEDKQTDCTGR